MRATNPFNSQQDRRPGVVGPLALGAVCAGLAISLTGPTWLSAACGALAGVVATSLAFRLFGARAAAQEQKALEATIAANDDACAEAPTPEFEAAEKGLDAAQEEAPACEASAPQQPGASETAALLAPGEEAKAPEVPTFDYAAFERRLLLTDDPLAELKLIVGSIRTRQANDKAVAPLEAFLARQLAEAGIFQRSGELPAFKIVKPARSGQFYLRVHDQQLPYVALLRIEKIEAALNAVAFANHYFAHPEEQTMEDFYRLQSDILTSICGQVSPLDEPYETQEGEDPDGEWAVRRNISEAVEALQLPYRLKSDFRVNVADGNVAFEVALTPEKAWATHSYYHELGILTNTRAMRRRAASDYALRVSLILANVAFRASRKIKHVWVAGCVDTPERHWCYLCVDFDRGRFSKLDLANVTDLEKVYRSFVPTMRLEEQILRPVEQTFQISEPRFCPPRRYEPVSLSARRIPKDQAQVLGTERVYGLAIEEADKRNALAADIARRLVPADDDHATEKNVRMVLDVAGDDPDPTVRQAAERLVARLIDGEVSPDPQSVALEFVAGDELSQAAMTGRELLQERRFSEARSLLREALAPVDARGDYDDTATIEWRYFNNYVDRALYNNLYAEKGMSLMLVPDTYFECHFLLSMAHLGLGQHDAALSHARRLFQMAPLDKRAHLHLVHCLEEAGREDDAEHELKTFISRAHDPQALGLGYYRMASYQLRAKRLVAAEACYRCALNFMPGALPMIGMEMATLMAQSPHTFHEDLTVEQIEEILVDNDIPAGPSQELSNAFYDCARATLDAEVFPVARNFIGLLGAFSGDDVILSMLRSLEGEPDA